MEAIRINAPLLASHKRKTIRLLAPIKSIDIATSTAILSSEGDITVKFEDLPSCNVGTWLDIVGMVGDDLSIRALQWNQGEGQVSEAAVKKMVDAWHKYPELFFDK
ncbi:hypothetical protein DAMA08_003690 [Martiniozyma asiatica (nom. inval.)]|nr:hypothetical protein DAMA08_003690 [Martiniozyma asiatica]